MIENKTSRINYKTKIRQNVALSLNGMHLNNPSSESWKPCRAASSSSTAWVDNAYVICLPHIAMHLITD